jgi:two-component system alkaline phosphatase synthesis response regulator PhoP
MSRKILIVDDEEDMRIYLQTLLRKAGYETDTAENGEDALTRFEEVNPDLITLDILMPQRSGLKFFQSLRERNTEIPVLVVSGVSGHNEFFDRNKLGGPTQFIEKPIQPDDFLSRIESLLEE